MKTFVRNWPLFIYDAMLAGAIVAGLIVAKPYSFSFFLFLIAGVLFPIRKIVTCPIWLDRWRGFLYVTVFITALTILYIVHFFKDFQITLRNLAGRLNDLIDHVFNVPWCMLSFCKRIERVWWVSLLIFLGFLIGTLASFLLR